jgi:hypothetical protein
MKVGAVLLPLSPRLTEASGRRSSTPSSRSSP